MRNTLKFLAVPAIAILSLSPLPAVSEPSADTVVASVGDQDITLGHMIILYSNLPAQYQQIPIEQLFDAILDQLIQQSALAQSLKGEVPATVRLSLDNERRALLAAVEISRALEDVATDEAIQAVYDKEYANAGGEQEFNASHILVETEDEAKALRDAIMNGADFAETAKEKSTGPSGPRGGALGWFGPGQMVPAFEEAVQGLKKGEVSEPIKTQFGWHVIKLNDTRSKAAPDLEDVRDEIINKIQADALEAHVQSAMDKVVIDRPDVSGIDPNVLSKTELLDE
ncbi:MAG: peptidylprolyl isomerase [Marinibacterium sp.]